MENVPIHRLLVRRRGDGTRVRGRRAHTLLRRVDETRTSLRRDAHVDRAPLLTFMTTVSLTGPVGISASGPGSGDARVTSPTRILPDETGCKLTRSGDRGPRAPASPPILTRRNRFTARPAGYGCEVRRHREPVAEEARDEVREENPKEDADSVSSDSHAESDGLPTGVNRLRRTATKTLRREDGPSPPGCSSMSTGHCAIPTTCTHSRGRELCGGPESGLR